MKANKTTKQNRKNNERKRKKETGKTEAPQSQVILWADINDHVCLSFHSSQM